MTTITIDGKHYRAYYDQSGRLIALITWTAS
jgi:hypothetical protein